MAYETAATVISDAALRLGLITAAVTNPWASTDPNILQLAALTKELGEELLRARDWTHLQKTHTFNTANGTANYALPAGFARFLDQTAWNRDTDLPLLGPVSPRDWALLKAVATASVIGKAFRTYADELYIHPTPTAIEACAFEYQSNYWVKPSGQSAPTTETPSAGTDTLHFDQLLLKKGLRFFWRRAKGMPSDADEADYERQLEIAKGSDGALPTLSLTRRSDERLLGLGNLPDTGYGS